MAVYAQELEDLLRAAFPNAQITVEGSDGKHMSAMVVEVLRPCALPFGGQRAVYAALKGKMDGPQGELHALALTTKAPE